MKMLFTGLYDFFRIRKPLLWVSFILTVMITGYFGSKLRLEESILQLLPADTGSGELNRFLGSSRFTDRVLIAVSQADTTRDAEPDLLASMADTLAVHIRLELGGFTESVTERAGEKETADLMDVINRHLPLFLDDGDYERLDSLTSTEGIKEQVGSDFRMITGPGGFALKQSIVEDPLGIRYLAYRKLNGIKVDEHVELYDGHFVTSDMRHALIFLQPNHPSSDTKPNAILFTRLDSLVQSLERQNTGVKFTWFGAPAVAAGNAMQIRTDMMVTVAVMVLLLVVFLSLFFRRITTPLIILVPVVTGGLFAMACVYLIQGSISVIALGAGSLVLGIAVNYSLHFLTHNRYHPDIRETIGELAFPMTMGSLTTIGGFLCLVLVNTPVLRDLGLFAALSLTGAAVGTLVFLPHFLRVQPDAHERQPVVGGRFGYLSSLFPQRARMAFILLCTPVLLYFAGGVQFEPDLNRMNYMSEKLKSSESSISRMTSMYQKSVFVISTGKSLDEALEAGERLAPHIRTLQSRGAVASVAQATSLLPSTSMQQRRLEKWKSYWSSARRDSVAARLVREGKAWHFTEHAFDAFRTGTETQFTPLDSSATATLRKLLDAFIEERDGTWSLVGIVRTSAHHANDVYQELSTQPNTMVVDRQQIASKLVDLVGKDFNFITLWTSVMVFVALLLIYGRIELTLITFIPMLVSWIWILGGMALFGIKFNMVNIVLSTFIFALGDDFCIFTTDALQREYAFRSHSRASVSISVALSALTTMLGMGALLFAKHPALHSIAMVSIIGIGSVWFISQTLQPALFRFLITRPTAQKHQPYTFFGIVKSVFAFSWFVFGSLLVSFIGVVFMKLAPLPKARKKYILHYLLAAFTGSLVRVMANVKKKIINERGEDFSKPAVIIANHSSFLDILLLTKMHPKLILLTNKWVWNSPVFGIAIRMAEYYPVAEGVEHTVPKLAASVAEGYSIVVFPEGTRSVDGTIGRFHKGAFYLAQQLGLDLLPLVIHGAQYTMTKNFFYLKDGQLTVKFLPRIPPGDPRLGGTLRNQAKCMGEYMREQLRLLADEIETPAYFRKRLFCNFIYKGPVLEWYMRVKVRLEDEYALFDQIIPERADILDIGCGYGFLDYMLSYTSSGRIVTGIDYDAEKIDIAQNGYDRNERLQFASADATKYEIGSRDVIVLNDVLHYIAENQQAALLDRCAGALNPGGILIVRDGIRELESRHRGTRVSEWFSTRLLKFNRTGQHGLKFISRSLIEEAAKRHGLELSVTDNTKYTSNLTFVLKSKTA